MLTLTDIFASLGAPLANSRWSWGAERPADGTVFLRVWQDECPKIDGIRAARLTAHRVFEGTPDNLGYSERLRHVALLEAGNLAFMIMCNAVDPHAHPRKIAGFNDREVFVGGRIIAHDGDRWLELKGRRPIGDVRPNKSLERSRER